ncbi:ABC transporter permease [Cerasicoccus arenae]|uniref:Oligopeptide transport system permease protein OppC n=1 Tax=Cerasicoccus arenae TaxID=424488 RepID=A0A8J3DCL4_9BACT|nr:ABC transporter permease subunit [Cerasicoccus arenae]MBK1858370.1 ABC transporter permease subunit [Cerasicoccus arenae]GHC09860.1 peptide ABC transporter permease [Cerasicoccus arenae]
MSSPAASLASARPASPWSDGWTRWRRNRLAVASTAVLALIILVCLIGPFFQPDSYYEVTDTDLGASAPSAEHWLGTDTLGRDLLARVMIGGRISFAVGLLASLVSMIIGVAYGIGAGLAGGNTDRIMMRGVELLQAMPFVIFVILLLTFFGRHFALIFVAIGAVEWLTMARIVRGQSLELKVREFVQAARALGQSESSIAWKHLLPNLFGVIIIYATLTVPNVMLLEAFISFLGLGVQAPMTSWGDLMHLGAETMEEYPWLLLFPAFFFSATLFSLNAIGDGLRDAFDPKS